MSSIPLWVVALVLAATAPLFARAFAAFATRRVEARTRSLLDRARTESLLANAAPFTSDVTREATREGET